MFLLSSSFCCIFTDICYDGNLPEVEIINLIEEQIPLYRLRADTITEFGKGYDSQDWIQTPVLPIIDDADLTPELTEEVLKYFGEFCLCVCVHACVCLYECVHARACVCEFLSFAAQVLRL